LILQLFYVYNVESCCDRNGCTIKKKRRRNRAYIGAINRNVIGRYPDCKHDVEFPQGGRQRRIVDGDPHVEDSMRGTRLSRHRSNVRTISFGGFHSEVSDVTSLICLRLIQMNLPRKHVSSFVIFNRS